MKINQCLGRAAGLAIMLAGAVSASAVAQPAPDANISFHGGSVAFIGGVAWGSGRLRFQGHRYGLKVNGLSIGGIGVNSYDAVGEIYNLRRPSDIEGVYAAVDASATAGAGAGEIDMKNDKGVEIRAHSNSAGLKLELGASGVNIRLDH
jgi:hypothetical protein